MKYTVLLLALLATTASAVTLTWINPTQYTDGTALTLAEFQRFDLSCSTQAGDRGVVTQTWIDTDPTRLLPDDLFTRGVPQFCALRVAVLDAVKTNGQTSLSDWSNEVSFTLPILRPSPPTGVAIAP